MTMHAVRAYTYKIAARMIALALIALGGAAIGTLVLIVLSGVLAFSYPEKARWIFAAVGALWLMADALDDICKETPNRKEITR
jgi:hypothetical protein